MAIANPAITLSMRISPKTRDKLDKLSNAMGRTKSYLAAEAIENYVSLHAWQVAAIEQSVTKANGKNAKFIEQSEVLDWVESWDTTNEKQAPQ